ncbi:MAG: hypothetical protein Q3985_01520 [Eubacteriales bacterium]|nr:hypothetical protein [Eubacteriales bacterium]
MDYVAMVGLLFVPLICLLCAAWFFVRWQNEREDEEKALHNKKICKRFLIATIVAAIVFGGLKIIFPFN